MVDGWRSVALEDVAQDITVGFVGPMASEYVSSGIPFLRSQNVEPLRINFEDTKYVSPSFHERLRKSALRPGDVVIVRTGKPGACAVVPTSLPVANCSDLVIVRCGPRLDPRFLAYYVNSSAAHHVASHLVGAVQQHFNVGAARRMQMLLPDLSEQRAIAHILGTLDDKIELNRRMNETLEALARAIFKSWFVDFDPVRAKMAGRQPVGMDAETAALFPDRMQESEIGEIPAGWKTVKIGDLLELAYGKALKADDRREGDVPVYGSNGQIGRHDECLSRGPGIVVGRKGNPGTVTWAPTDFFVIDTGFYVVPKKGSRSLHFLFHALRTHDLSGLGADSAVPGLNRNLAYMSVQVLPPDPLIARFDALNRALSERVHVSALESRTLAALRDTLLPKLLSGELRIPDAEKLVEAAT